jgi:hypothetical protein
LLQLPKDEKAESTVFLSEYLREDIPKVNPKELEAVSCEKRFRAISLQSVQLLPGNIGFVFEGRDASILESNGTVTDLDYRTSFCPLVLVLFNKKSVLVPPMGKYLHCQIVDFFDENLTCSTFCMTSDGTIVITTPRDADIVQEIPLHDFIQQEKTPRMRLHALYTTLTFFASPLIGLIDSYVASPSKISVLPSLDDCINKIWMILNDEQYFTGKCADEVRALFKVKRGSTKLSELKDVFAKYPPQAFTHSQFGYDSRTNPEKMLFKMFSEINCFEDLLISDEFEKVQVDWSQFHSQHKTVAKTKTKTGG